jgi:predicted nucleic acid-binding protein
MIVLDASVIAKWFLEEPKSSEALHYRDLHAQKKEIIIAPSILIYEMANFFRYKKDFTEREIVF